MPTITNAKVFFSLFFTMIMYLAQAQTPSVRFRITNAANQPVGYATLKIISATDSTQVLEKVSDSAGRTSFPLLQGNQYTVQVTAVGYQPFQKGILVQTVPSSFSFQLQPDDKKLSAVVVTASKPLLRQEDDKTIVEPEQLAATSTNAFEMMEKVPGIFMDSEGNIYLNSTTPAQVYINGREQRMSAADIATMLKNLPPNAIASIEIMRTPSARYDASGSGGVVNVIFRKGVRIGLTGSVTAGGNQGRYGNQFIGLNLNNNNGNLTTYLNLNAARRNNYDQLETDRIFSIDSLLSQRAFTRYASTNYYVGFGFSYQLSKKWEIAYDGRLNYNVQDNRSNNQSRIAKISSSQTLLTNITDVNNKGKNYNITNGLNFKYRIDSLGSEWTTDLSFTYAPNNVDQLFNTGDGDINNRLRFFSAQTNYTRKLKHRITFETGLKTTGVYFNNTTDYYRNKNNNREKDIARTGAYQYNENIHAAYIQASKGLGSFVLKVGTRMENTNMNGKQLVPKDTSFSISRTDFFPYVYLSRPLMKIASYELRGYLVYRRTISRPAYEYLNPTQRFIDPFLFETGNPTLRPQFTNNYEANISFEERPIFAVGI
ncbi:MAG TPA: TonB-dependent receptor, partial [Flavisolibacter sp.]|nr:TonB-dependent receptor [Flavisolibacter sp.]